MNSFELIPIFVIIYSIYWLTLILGIILIKQGSKSAEKMRVWFWNKRILQFQYPPFSTLLKFWKDNRYFLSSLIFLIIILNMVVVYFLFGLILVTPLLAVFQAILVGVLTGYGDTKNLIWSVAVLIFEFGYFALAGALGLFITIKFLLGGLSFVDSFLIGAEELLSGYWILIVICVLGNAFLEIAGPIFWNMKGGIGLAELSQKQFLNDKN